MNSDQIPAFTIPATKADPSQSEADKQAQFERIAALLKARDAVIVAHYYTGAAVQELAEQTGGFIGDSLAMAKFGMQHPAKTLIVAGVRFMGESAKILSPEKTVLMPTLEAECSLDLGCPADLFEKFIQDNPGRTVVVYANTSAKVKALSDWVVTSSNAVQIVEHLKGRGEKILWAPDRYLGGYIQQKTGADMILWQGSCIVHEEFKAKGILDLKLQYPDAAVLVHPESPMSVVDMADVVGSTAQLLKAVSTLPNKTFIVATDRGIFYKMKEAQPDRVFIEAPTAGNGATCRSCGHCPLMAMNQLNNLEQSLKARNSEIKVDEQTQQQARVALDRMVNFKI